MFSSVTSLQKIFSSTLYIKVFANQFVIRHIGNKQEITIHVTEAFTTKRLLLGEFSKAEKCLKEGMVKIHTSGWLSPAPVVLIQPMEMTEGGLSEIEERAFYELAKAAGARKVLVWIGDVLLDHDVLTKLKTQQ